MMSGGSGSFSVMACSADAKWNLEPWVAGLAEPGYAFTNQIDGEAITARLGRRPRDESRQTTRAGANPARQRRAVSVAEHDASAGVQPVMADEHRRLRLARPLFPS